MYRVGSWQKQALKESRHFIDRRNRVSKDNIVIGI